VGEHPATSAPSLFTHLRASLYGLAPRPSLTSAQRRLYLVIAASAIAVYLGALANGYALDDVPIIATNPLVHRWSVLWEAFARPYWPPAWGAEMYRPLPIVSFALDWRAGVGWLHAANLLWHAGVSLAVAALALRLSGSGMAALVAGMLFAVHPVHVEAVANIVGRAELMATLFVVLSVLAALEHDRLGWSLAALALGLLSKEIAATTPALVASGWLAETIEAAHQAIRRGLAGPGRCLSPRTVGRPAPLRARTATGAGFRRCQLPRCSDDRRRGLRGFWEAAGVSVAASRGLFSG
jgi:hypothetical protein